LVSTAPIAPTLTAPGARSASGRASHFSSAFFEIRLEALFLVLDDEVALQNLAARRHAPQGTLQAGEFQAGVSQELPDGVGAVVLPDAQRDGDEVLQHQFGVLLGPEGRRTAHRTAATSTRPDAGGTAGRVDEQGLPFFRRLLTGLVQVEEPRNVHPP
jgi:hypothetical protein